MYDPDRYKAKRASPTQTRGKERVRVILAAALDLFRERGVEEITTNEIAEHAGIPIGSLYRYFPNKDAIITALTELYTSDIAQIFDQIGEHPLLKYMSWDEVLLLLIDAWVNYTTLNGPFTFLYAEKANPRLRDLNMHYWQHFVESFNSVLHKRCPEVGVRESALCFHLALAAVDVATNEQLQRLPGVPLHHEVSGAIAGYMIKSCDHHAHSSRMLA